MPKISFSSFGRFGPLVLLWTAATLLLPGCGREKSERERILLMIERIQEDVEDRNLERVLDRISEDFRDMENRSKSEVREFIADHFDRHHGIVVHILGTRFLGLEAGEADIETEVSLSSGAAKVFRKLIRYSGQNYRFSLHLVRDEAGWWQVSRAGWRFITLEELFPESFKLLKKVFPDI